MALSIYLAPVFLVLGLVLAVLDEEHRRLWLMAAGSMVLFGLWAILDAQPGLVFVAWPLVFVPPVSAVILAIFDRKYRLRWSLAAAAFTLIGAVTFLRGAAWVLSALGGL